MKRAVAFALLFACTTCDGIDNFQVDETSRALIPGATIVDELTELPFGSFGDIDLSQNTELKNQGATKDNIDSVKISVLELTVIDPASGQDFTFLTSLKFFVEAPGLPRALIASGGPFPEGASKVELTLEDVELKPYATAESMSITTESNGRRPRQDTTVDAAISLDVDVNVGGALCGG
jgi:hypothetical protein